MLKHPVSISEERRRIQLMFMVPMIVTLIVMIIVPLCSLFIFSFTSVKVGFTDFNFIGLENYVMLFEDTYFQTALFNTLFMMTCIVLLQMILGYLLAIVIYKSHFFRGAIRLIMMFPMVVSPIIVGLMWRILLMPKFGGFNILLSSLGVNEIPDWFGGVWLSKMVIIFAATWEWTPFVVLYLLAGLEGLPSAPFESAKIDGVNSFQETFFITIPMLKKLLITVFLFRIVEGFKIFPLIFAITSGGPGRATEDLTYMVYKNGFRYLKLGYASATSMIILVLIASVVIIIGFLDRKK